MHSLLRRQLRRFLGSEEPPPGLAELLAAIDGAYSEFDADRQMVERSLELASDELIERHALLEKSEEYFRSLIEKSSDVILVLDSKAEVTYASGSAAVVMGYPPEQVVGRSGFDFVHPDDLSEVQQSLARTVFGVNEPVSIEFRALHADGTWRILEAVSGRVIDPSGQTSVVVNCRDVTERKEAEEDLARLVNLAPDVIYTLAANGSIKSLNPAFEAITGWSCEEWLGRDFRDLQHPDDLAMAEDRFKRQLNGEPVPPDELHILTKDGHYLTAEFTTAPLIKDGVVVGVMGIARDVTERKRNEQHIRENEERLRLATQTGKLGIWEWDITNDRITWTPNVARMHGLPEGNFNGTLLEYLSLIHHDDREGVLGISRQITDPQTPEYSLHYRAQHPDGNIRWIEGAGRLYFDESGRPVRTLGVAMDVTERHQAEEKIKHLAYHDALTGLPNRDLLRDRMDQAMSQARRANEQLAILYVDLDRFKNVNDSIGHSGGDRLLCEIASRLSHVTRDGDTIARLGGDEFVVLVPRVDTAQDAVETAKHILEALRSPVILDGEEFRATASIGLALFPDDGHDVDSLIRNADIAMYRAKDNGRDNLQMYRPSMNETILQRIAIERELLHAIENEEFVVYYQPLVEASSGRIVGAEALIRWLHPQRGLVLPDEFIPVAEDSGLILEIGAWVMDAACRRGAEWERIAPGFRVAVNVSARQLREAAFVSLIRDHLWNTGISPQALELEVTETAAMESPERVGRALAALKDIGVCPVIDDFGTGYSSLSRLKRLPVTKLKIDKSFTQDVATDPNNAAIASATIAMAHSLGLSVTAEGVETQEEANFYRAKGCDEMQGYLFGKPGSAEQITRMIARSAGKDKKSRAPIGRSMS